MCDDTHTLRRLEGWGWGRRTAWRTVWHISPSAMKLIISRTVFCSGITLGWKCVEDNVYEKSLLHIAKLTLGLAELHLDQDKNVRSFTATIHLCPYPFPSELECLHYCRLPEGAIVLERNRFHSWWLLPLEIILILLSRCILVPLQEDNPLVLFRVDEAAPTTGPWSHVKEQLLWNLFTHTHTQKYMCSKHYWG